MKPIRLVCIIEDDPVHAVITKKYLELSQMVEEIILYHNGKEAYDGLVERATTNAEMPNLILLDLNMPIWDGWQFLEAFLKLPTSSASQIYILSSSNNDDDRSRAKVYGLLEHYLLKPISLPAIKEVLETVE